MIGRLRGRVGGLRVVLVRAVGGVFVWSGFESDLFLRVLVWGWRERFIRVGGLPSSFFGSVRDNPEDDCV